MKTSELDILLKEVYRDEYFLNHGYDFGMIASVDLLVKNIKNQLGMIPQLIEELKKYRSQANLSIIILEKELKDMKKERDDAITTLKTRNEEKRILESERDEIKKFYDELLVQWSEQTKSLKKVSKNV